MKGKIQKNWALALVAALTLAGLCYVAVCGQDIYAQVGDNLDSNLPWFTMLRNNHLFFAHGAKVPFLGGIDRDYLPTEWNFYSLLYWLLPAFPAYIVGNVAKIVLAVWGWLALNRLAYGRDAARTQNLAVLVGFVYANLPTYPAMAIAFGALPLGLALLWQIYRAPRRWYFALLPVWVATSDFSTLGIFCCGFLLLFFLADWLRTRRPAWRLLLALAVLCASFMLLEYRLFGIMLFSNVATLRDTMVTDTMALRDLPARTARLFWEGDQTAGTLQSYLVMPVCCLYYLWQNVGFVRRRNWRGLLLDPFNLLMYWLVFNALVATAQYSVYFQAALHKLLPVLAGFNFSRSTWVSPLLVYLAFFLLLARLVRRGYAPAGLLLAGASFAVVLLCPAGFNEIQRNFACKAEKRVTGSCETLTWREFYAEDLLAEIKTDLGYDGEWTAAFGLHPGILEQSGFATLDGYLSYYPLSYKAQFRRLIAPGLTPGSYYQQYYDGWGGRAYLFAEGVPYGPRRDLGVQSAALPIDAAVFREMGGRYIISRLAVTNTEALGLRECGVYTNENTPYTLYVYCAD